MITFINSTFAGVIQFGIVADQSMENGVTADSVHPEPPLYSEEVAQVNSNASTLKMELPEPRYANLNVVRKKTKNDQKGFFKIRRKLGSRLSNGRHERFAIFFPQLAVKPDIFDIFFNFVSEMCHGNQNIRNLQTSWKHFTLRKCLFVSFFFLSKVVHAVQPSVHCSFYNISYSCLFLYR